jgi:hypothetical protein
MKRRIAVFAACAGILVLAQPDIARANHGGTFALESWVGSKAIRPAPAIVLAAKISDNDSPIPVDRRALKARKNEAAKTHRSNPANSGATGSSIFDRWPNSKNRK